MKEHLKMILDKMYILCTSLEELHLTQTGKKLYSEFHAENISACWCKELSSEITLCYSIKGNNGETSVSTHPGT